MKLLYGILGLGALLGPIGYALHKSSNSYNESFWEFYPLFISGALLALIFFYAAGKNR